MAGRISVKNALLFVVLGVGVSSSLTSTDAARGGGAQLAQESVKLVDTRAAYFETDPGSFLCFTMDASETCRWFKEKNAFWYNDTVIALAREIPQCYFRYGGTSEDFTEYSFGGASYPTNSSDHNSPCQMNETVFKGLVDFTDAVGWKLIFGANEATYRDGKNGWDSDAFRQLLKYAKSLNANPFGFELGNEPDLFFKHQLSANITSAQLAKDFTLFASIVAKYFDDARIIGPDTALSSYHEFAPFLEKVDPALNIIATWHFYYGPGSSRPHGLSPTNFSSPAVLDKFMTAANSTLSDWSRAGSSSALWVGETSSTYGGGTSNASASFIAGFMWLDKLGIAARWNQSVVCRQVFAHASYSVIGYDNIPNPDYYTSVLWKRLVGSKVLRVAGDTAPLRDVRVYSFCSAKSPSGDVVFVFLNTRKEAAEIKLADPFTRAEMYELTSQKGNPLSRSIYLNGRVLELGPDGKTLPDMQGAPIDPLRAIELQPLSYGFVVASGSSSVSACL